MYETLLKLIASTLAVLALAQLSGGAELGPLIRISGDSPFRGNDADNVAAQSGINFLGSEVEPYVVIDPTNRQHLVSFWQQDRWSNGGARSNVVGVSMDGGETWQVNSLPGLTLISGAKAREFEPQRATDPWLSFTPAGELYAMSLLVESTGRASAMVVNKSTDGGLSWDEPTTLVESLTSPPFHDKGSITADPRDADVAYAVWNQAHGPAMFTRTTDGGRSWQPARVVSSRVGGGHQVSVLPNGDVVDTFSQQDGGSELSLIRSNDQGETWSDAIEIAEFRHGASHGIFVGSFNAFNPDEPFSDLNSVNLLRTGGGFHDVAMDPRNGNLYAVWSDGRMREPKPLAEPLSAFLVDRIGVAFAMSTDGGETWSEPIQIDGTPLDIELDNQQSFLPSIAVAADGSIGVTYYDFRHNAIFEPGLATDVFFIRCGGDCAECTSWRDEERLTDVSFDFEQSPSANGLFLGDYHSLVADGNDFLAIFSQPHDADPASVFFRRIVADVPEPSAACLIVSGLLGLVTYGRSRIRLRGNTAPGTARSLIRAPADCAAN